MIEYRYPVIPDSLTTPPEKPSLDGDEAGFVGVYIVELDAAFDAAICQIESIEVLAASWGKDEPVLPEC